MENKNLCYNKIHEISMLPNNWDGYNSSNVDKIVCDNASYFIQIIDDKIISTLSSDDITPTPYGTITFDFINDRSMVSVEVGNSKIGFFSSFSEVKDTVFDVEQAKKHGIPSELKKAFEMLLKN